MVPATLSTTAPGRETGGASVVIPGAVFATALLLRVVCLAQLHRSGMWDYIRLDPLYYYEWARRIAAGEVLGAGTYEMTPLYAWTLGALFGAFGDGLFVPRLAQAILGAGTCALVAWLGLRVFGRAEAILAGLALALYGPSLFHETQIMKTVLTVALSTATAAILYLSRGTRWRVLLGGGFLLGLTTLSQENMKLTLPLFVAWVLWRARPWLAGAACAGALMAGFLMAVAPAALRNLHVSGDFVLVTSGGGEVFYTGNNESASGRYGPPAFVRPDPFFEHEDFRAEAERRLGRRVTRAESDDYWWHEGLRFIRENPVRWAGIVAEKLGVYLNDYERPDNYSYENFQRFVPVLRLPLVRFGWLAPLGLIGLALSARRWPDLLPLHATMGIYLLSALIFFTQSRYRMPMIPMLALFAAHGLSGMARAIRGRNVKRLAWSLPAVAIMFLFVHRDPGNTLLFEAQNHGILGEMLLHAGRPQEAVEEFRAAIVMLADYPGDSAGEQHRRVADSSRFGIALAREEGAAVSDEELLAVLQGAAEAPDDDLRHDVLAALGGVLMTRGDPSGAAEAWQGAIGADPNDIDSRLRLAEALHKAGRPDDALATAARVLNEFPNAHPSVLASAHYGKALIYLAERPDPERAADHLREVLRLDPQHPRAEWIRARLAAIPSGAPHPRVDAP